MGKLTELTKQFKTNEAGSAEASLAHFKKTGMKAKKVQDELRKIQKDAEIKLGKDASKDLRAEMENVINLFSSFLNELDRL